MNDKLKAINEFERMRKEAKLNTYQKISLERKLTDAELVEFKALALELKGVRV